MYLAAVVKRGVLVLDKGRVLLDDCPEKIFENVALIKSIGLDVPQTTELLYELYREGVKVSFEKLTVDECIDEIKKILEENK